MMDEIFSRSQAEAWECIYQTKTKDKTKLPNTNQTQVYIFNEDISNNISGFKS